MEDGFDSDPGSGSSGSGGAVGGASVSSSVRFPGDDFCDARVLSEAPLSEGGDAEPHSGELCSTSPGSGPMVAVVSKKSGAPSSTGSRDAGFGVIV